MKSIILAAIFATTISVSIAQTDTILHPNQTITKEKLEIKLLKIQYGRWPGKAPASGLPVSVSPAWKAIFEFKNNSDVPVKFNIPVNMIDTSKKITMMMWGTEFIANEYKQYGMLSISYTSTGNEVTFYDTKKKKMAILDTNYDIEVQPSCKVEIPLFYEGEKTIKPLGLIIKP